MIYTHCRVSLAGLSLGCEGQSYQYVVDPQLNVSDHNIFFCIHIKCIFKLNLKAFYITDLFKVKKDVPFCFQ